MARSEAIEMLCAAEILALAFWLVGPAAAPHAAPDAHTTPPRLASLAALALNAAAAAAAAAKPTSERRALVLLASFTTLVAALAVDVALSHPTNCARAPAAADSIGGSMLIHLLWTADACTLMSVLAWVLLGAGLIAAMYLAIIIIAFYRAARSAGADARVVNRTIAALPLVRYGKQPLAPLLAAEGRHASEMTSCAICLGDFEPNEELRELACVHTFHRACIETWIMRQGLEASCPLCKRELIPRPATPSLQGDVPVAHEGRGEGEAAAAGVQPLLADEVGGSGRPSEPGPSSSS